LKNLEQLLSLRRLDLACTRVDELAALASLRQLVSLDLASTTVRDLAPLAGHTEWKYLFLNNNKITDLSLLVADTKKDAEGEKRFAPFWRLYIGDNPLSEMAKMQLQELKKYGTRVFLTYP
jgi:hypothetical protein